MKMFTFFKRKPGMSVEDFQTYWSTGHAQLAVKMGGKRRYIQNHTLPSAYAGGNEPVWDGVPEGYFESPQVMKDLARTKEYETLRADEPNFIDLSTMCHIYTEEHIIKDGPVTADSVKMMLFVNRKPDMDLDEFRKYWREVHPQIGLKVPGGLRYVQNHTWRSFYDSGQTPVYDGVAEMWYESMQAIKDAVKTPEYALSVADARNFLSTDSPPMIIVREKVIVP